MIRLYCPSCNFKKNIFESELMDNGSCPLCNNILLKETEDISCPSENGEICNKGKACDSCKDNTDQIGMSENLDRIMVNSLINEIKGYGEDITWANIQVIDFEHRLAWLECFFEAKRKLTEV
jgi:hypothetical protein